MRFGENIKKTENRMSYLMKSGLKVENPGYASCLTPGREPKTPMHIPKNPVKVCSALPAVFSLDEKVPKANNVHILRPEEASSVDKSGFFG